MSVSDFDFASFVTSSTTAVEGAFERAASRMHVSLEELKSLLPPQVSEFTGLVFLVAALVFVAAVLSLDCLSREKTKTAKTLDGEADDAAPSTAQGESTAQQKEGEGEDVVEGEESAKNEDEDEDSYEREGENASRSSNSSQSEFANPGETPARAYRGYTGEDEASIQTPPPSAKSHTVPTSTRSTHRSRTQSRVRGRNFQQLSSMTPVQRRPQRAAKLASGYASAGRSERKFDRDASGFLRPIARKLDLGEE